MTGENRQADRARTANILAAFALAMTDKIDSAMRGAASGRGGMASAALVQIASDPGLSIERLRTSIGLSHSATVRIVDQLEAAALVVRSRSAAGDSRVAELHLTPRGEDEANAGLAARRAVLDRALQRLGPPDVEALSRLVEKAMGAVVELGADQDVVCRLCDLSACPQERCPVSCLDGEA